VSLRSGSRGVFKVSVDDQVVFDKAAMGRFPRKGELTELLEPVLGRPLDWR
jgi:selT/selW/selH-like putative selenoprotein